MKSLKTSARFLAVFLSMTVAVGLLLLIRISSLDVSAVSVPSMPEGTEFVLAYPNSTNGTVSDVSASDNNSHSLVCPVLPNKSYTFRFFSPLSVSYFDRFRIALYTPYPSVGTSGRIVVANPNSLVRYGDYLSVSFDTSSSDYYVMIFLWGYYPNNPDLPERYLGYISPELFYDAEININAFPERFYPGDDVTLISTNVTQENTYFAVGYRSIGDTEIISIGTFAGDSYGFTWTWSVPYSMESGPYEFIVRAQTKYQVVSVPVPFVVLISPSPAIPEGSSPVTPDISALPDTSDFIFEFPEEFVEVTFDVWDLIPYELYPLLMMSMVCLLIVALIRRSGD